MEFRTRTYVARYIYIGMRGCLRRILRTGDVKLLTGGTDDGEIGDFQVYPKLFPNLLTAMFGPRAKCRDGCCRVSCRDDDPCQPQQQPSPPTRSVQCETLGTLAPPPPPHSLVSTMLTATQTTRTEASQTDSYCGTRYVLFGRLNIYRKGR